MATQISQTVLRLTKGKFYRLTIRIYQLLWTYIPNYLKRRGAGDNFFFIKTILFLHYLGLYFVVNSWSPNLLLFSKSLVFSYLFPKVLLHVLSQICHLSTGLEIYLREITIWPLYNKLNHQYNMNKCTKFSFVFWRRKLWSKYLRLTVFLLFYLYVEKRLTIVRNHVWLRLQYFNFLFDFYYQVTLNLYEYQFWLQKIS